MLSTGDRVALTDLVARYALYADRRDLDGLAGLFTPDAVLVLPNPPKDLAPVLEHTGREAVRRALSAVEAIPVTSHALTGQVFDPGPDPGTALGHVSCTAHHLTAGEDGKVTDLSWHLHYTDTYRSEDGTWRIARRALQIDWIETTPVRRWRA